NCTPCSASKRESASVRPISPTWIRSSTSTLAGSLAIIWCARRRTSGLYCLISVLLSRRPLGVYMMVSSRRGSVRCDEGGRHRARRAQRGRSGGGVDGRSGGGREQQLAGEVAQLGVERRAVGGLGVQAGPVAQHRAEETVGAGVQLLRDAGG